MTTSLYGTSYSSIYAKELKNIRAEQEVEEEQRLAKKEGRKVVSAGGMHTQAYIGKGAKKLASKKLEEASTFLLQDTGRFTDPIKKWETVAGKTPELFDKMGSFGDVGKTAWEGFESYTGMSFSGEATQLTSEYLTGALAAGEDVAELGISKAADLFKPITTTSASGLTSTATPQVGASEKIMATLGKGDAATQVHVGTATLGEGGKVTTEILEKGIAEVSKGSATASVGAVAGKAAAGIGIATGGYQAISGFAEGDIQSGIAGTAKAVGGAMMFTPLAPIGLALSGVGTLLDFV
jgi:hypothetical protein